MATSITSRAEEIATLDKILASDRAEFLAVYGRRRVWKTFLIYEHFKPNLVFSFSGSFEQPLNKQINNFFSEYLRITKGQLEVDAPKDWSTTCSYLTDYINVAGKKTEDKIVIFIDEMPWLDTRSTSANRLELL